MASITDAFKIIAKELPQFFTQTGTPFLGKDQEGSVMKEKDAMQKEKEFIEALTTAGILATPVGKGIVGAGKVIASKPKTAALLTAAATQDPTMLLPGGLGLLAQSNDAEAMVVPASLTKGDDVIAKALGMLKEGQLPKHIYKETGVYEGPIDKAPRAVISDAKARIKDLGGDTLGEVIDHPELFAKLPYLKDIEMRFLSNVDRKIATASHVPATKSPTGKEMIGFNPERNVDELLSSILHETQHSIQTKHGWIEGGNPKLEQSSDRFATIYDDTITKLESDKPSDRVDLFREIGKQLYRRGAGEAEARATEEMLRTKNYEAFPLDYYDVPIEKLLKPAQ